MTTLDPSYLLSSENKASTSELIQQLIDGKLDPASITMAEYLQLTFIAAMNNDVLHVEQPIIYGGQYFNVHMCMSKVGPSPSLDDALSGRQ